MNKQALMIMVHDYSNLSILKKQLEILDSEYFDIFIHIDKKSKTKIEDIEKCKKSKLHIYKEIKVYWGHDSQVKCHLFLIKEVLNQKEKYDYLHLISGTDLPLKKPKEIHAYFNRHYGKEFIHFQNKNFPEYKECWVKYYSLIRFKSYDDSIPKRIDEFLRRLQIILKIDRIKKFDFKVYTGTCWFSITDEFAKFVITKEKILEKLKYTVCTDEIFIQTVCCNSIFKKNLYYKGFDDNYDACKRLLKWVNGKAYVWKMEDLKEIEESNAFFARKFDCNVDEEIIDYLYEKIISNKN